MRPGLLALPVLSILGACAATSPSAAPAPDAGYDGGFVLSSEDGSRELVIEGLFQTTVSAYDSDRTPSTDFGLKRMRPEFSGQVDALRFKLEPKFTEHEVELEEAWIGADFHEGNGRLMLGRMKAPFGLEEVRSRRHIDFPSFSLVNQLSPAEDHGIFYNGKTEDGFVEYGLAATNGTGASDTNSSKDLVGRVMVHPSTGLQLGVAATVGQQSESTSGSSLKNEAGLPVVDFASNSALDGTRTRLGLEAAWYRGPWFAQAELVDVQQDMSAGGGPAQRVGFGGGYLSLSRALTGEDKSFSGVDPDSPFDPSTGAGRGAWVLAMRLSQLEIDDDLVLLGLANPGRSTDQIRSASLGLNWVPNRHAIVRHALIWSEYGDPIDLGSGTSDEELALVVEFQLHF